SPYGSFKKSFLPANQIAFRPLTDIHRKSGPPKADHRAGRATMTVSAILDRKGHQVVTVHPDIPLSEAIRVLTERGIGAVVVVTDDGIEGILSERDILHALGSRGAAALDA